MIGAQLGKRDPLGERNAALAPHAQRLRRQAKGPADVFLTDSVDQSAINVFMSSHDETVHAALIQRNRETLIELHGGNPSTVAMVDIADRLRRRLDELDLTPADAARAAGCSPQRFSNYLTATRKPDIEMLARLAKALRTSTDWLLGLSEVVPIDARTVVLRLLELDGMTRERAEVIAQAAEEALRLLASLPAEGDARSRAHLAAQAAWQMKPPSKPS